MHLLRITAIAAALALFVSACTGGKSAQSPEEECLDAIGELQAVSDQYHDLLDAGVEQMREDGAADKLQGISEDLSQLRVDLNLREQELPEEVLPAHGLLASGIGMQASAWMSISDGLRVNDPDLINDGAQMISQARDLLEQSNAALPDCSGPRS